jgi:DNA polymerase elongation subunit (family B)
MFKDEVHWFFKSPLPNSKFWLVNTSPHCFIPSITDELMNERDKYKAIADEMDQTFADLAGY